MANVLKPEKQEQIRALGRLGWSLRRIEKATGVRRETVSGYLRQAGITVRDRRARRLRGPDSKPASQVTTDSGGDSKPASQPFPDLPDDPGPGGRPRPSTCEGHRDVIEEALARGRNAKAIWQDLVTGHGFDASYECVKRFVRKLRGSSTRVAHPRIVTEPGEEGQVDYGSGPMVRDASGRYRRTRLFTLTLGCSRKSVWLLTWRSSSAIWCELHETAFTRLGGTVKTIVLDNLKEGVLKPDVYDPELNPLYRDMLAHYGVVALPAKCRDPNRKGKVESAVGLAKNTPLKGMRFESLEKGQAYLDRWATRWADTRIHGTTKRQVAAMFAEEKPSLQPLPIERFSYYEYGVRTVHLDGCVEVAAAYYSAPPGWLGKRVNVQWSNRFVRLLHPTTGALLREHLRQKRGAHRVHKDDRSPKSPPGVQHLLARARSAGMHVGRVCEAIEQRRGQTSARSVLGVLSLVKKHGPVVVDQVCQTALDAEAPTYRFVRKYIERVEPQAPQLRQVDALSRNLSHYRDFIDNTPSTQSP